MKQSLDYHPDKMEAAREAFERAHPAFAGTRSLDDLRAREYSCLDKLGHVYLDYTGGGLYAERQLRQHMTLLNENVFGNPHSNNPTSLAMTELVEQARAYVLAFFNAPPDDYTAIFTQNASGALKHVGESYPFDPDSHYLLTFDNHNSVNGVREFAWNRGARVTYLPVARPDLRMDEDKLTEYLALAQPGANNLFAFPAQSNFSGVQHPLELIERAHRQGWDVLLDSAAFVPTNRLDLSRWQPDFAAISFYKIFGFPTGVGCLLARKSALDKLRRPWFAGGTITIASVQAEGYYLAEGEAAFEDGTVDYLNLPAVEIGLRHIAAAGIETIHQRVKCLTGWLLDHMLSLRHSNGAPLVRLHGPRDLSMRGGTLAVDLLDPQGRAFDERRVEELANRANISLRTGCFCNPGAGEVAYGLSEQQMAQFFGLQKRLSFLELRSAMLERFGKHIGAIRISVGMVTNFADVYRFMAFLTDFLDRTTGEIGDVEIEPSHTLIRDSA